MKNLISLMLVLSVLLVLVSCGRTGDSGNSSTSDESKYYIGMDSSKPIDRYNKPQLIKDIQKYSSPVYTQEFDPERQTLSESEYDKLYNAIVKCNESFPGVVASDSLNLVNLADVSKTEAMINYMSYKYGAKTFSEAEVKLLLGEKFALTSYDIYALKISEYVNWQPKDNTYAFYKINEDNQNLGHRDGYNGYRDMGENMYEFYFCDMSYKDLEFAVEISYGISSAGKPPMDQYLSELYASEKNGVITVEEEGYVWKYYRCNTPEGARFICYDKLESGVVVTMEYKEGKIKLVDIRNVSSYPVVYSKIPN